MDNWEAETLNISGIVDDSIVDGPGLRYTIFVQGCPHGCPECHNPQTHSFEENKRVTLGQLNVVDVLVDGPFLIAERDLELLYRGSRNQRLIDLKEMRDRGDMAHVILWQEI